MIEIRNLNFDYEGKKNSQSFLNIDSLKIPENKITAIIGPNGSGKSTFLKVFAGILKPSSGEILLSCENKINILQKTGKERAKTIAFVPQSRNIPDMTVSHLVLHGRYPHQKSNFGFSQSYGKKDFEVADFFMKKLDILDISQKNLKKVSGGQRQKAYLAMSLAQTTPILVLDEPLTYLDIHQQLELMAVLKELREEKTILIVIHDLNMALKYSDNLILFQNGSVLSTGTPDELFSSGLIQKAFDVNISKENSYNFYLP